MKVLSSRILAGLVVALMICFTFNNVLARGGGGGGHSSGGGGHSSGGSHGSSSGGGGFYVSPGYGGGGNGGSIDGGTIVFVIIVVVVILVIITKFGKRFAPAKQIEQPAIQFPEGLDAAKVEAAFMGVQKSWQEKNLKDIRKWISDGVYQRYTAQFAIMNKLDQVNRLSNIRINGIRPTKTAVDGNYQTVDVGISFTIDDEFISNKYPQFNERYVGDQDVEYWTFIKRNDASGTNMYNTANCPNCASPFTTEMGEVSRCQNCGTLTNTASFDWVLSEITQDEAYPTSEGPTNDSDLQQLTRNDKYFSVQRMEDIASNVFMQTMQVFSGEKEQRLARFANKETIAAILGIRADYGNFVFNRLYLDEVTLSDYNTADGRLNLIFTIVANFQRVQAGQSIKLVDVEIMTRSFHVTLSKNLSALNTPAKETAFSYECPTCAAPYTDTTNDVCPYCGTGVTDMDHNWVLTDFVNG